MLEEGTKTTSELEKCHRQFATTIGVERPSFGRLFHALQLSHARVEHTLGDIKAGVTPPSKKSAHELKKDTMYNVIQAGYNKDGILDYLEKVSDVMKFGFE